MNWLRGFLWRLQHLGRARAIDRDLQEQIEGHLAEATDDYLRQGLDPDEARRAARRRFGGVRQAQEAWRDVRSFPGLDHWWRDVRHGARALRRNPGFSSGVVIVLGLGIAAVTSVFAVLNRVVLQPLPFPAADQLVVIRHRAPGLGLDDAGLSSGLFFHYMDHARALQSIAAYGDQVAMNLRLPGEASERISVAYTSAAVFTVLGTQPALGRLFTEEDGRPGFMNMRWQIPVLLSHELWNRRFGGDPAVIGRVLTINLNPREVIGVLPEGFAFPNAGTQVWMLLEPSRSAGNLTDRFKWNAIGRMRSGVTAAAAAADLAAGLRLAIGSYSDATPERLSEIGLAPVVIPLKSHVIGDVDRVIWLLFAGLMLLGLVGCANVAGLFLVRAHHRAHEMAVRRALGASVVQIGRLAFAEASILTSVAAVSGLLIARGLLSMPAARIPFDLPRTSEIALDGAAVLFAAAASVCVALGCGILCVRIQRSTLTTAGLGAGSRSTSNRLVSWSGALIAVQVAFALALVAGSGLMVQTYRTLAARDLGFSPDDVLTAEINLVSRKASQHVRIYQEVVDRLRRFPQVEHASAASFVPLTATEHLFPVESGSTSLPFKFFLPGYFQAMGTSIVEGEPFLPGGRPAAAHPVLISRALARRLYPDGTAVGRSVRRLEENGTIPEMGRGPVPPFTIAGIVADVSEMSVRHGAAEAVYIPVIDPPVEPSIVPTNMHLVVRARAPLETLAAAVRQAVAETDSDLSVGRIETMAAIVSAARGRERFVGLLLLAAAAVSMAVGAAGIYASVAQVVRLRRRELGIRLALGASRTGIVRTVTAGTLRPVLIGMVGGLALSLAAGRLLSSLLFGVDPHEPTILIAAMAALLGSAAAAMLLAARHAAHLPPQTALQGE